MNKTDYYLRKDHSLHYLQMAFRADKHKIIEKPYGYGKRKGLCGDTVEMFIRVRNVMYPIGFIYFQWISQHLCLR